MLPVDLVHCGGCVAFESVTAVVHSTDSFPDTKDTLSDTIQTHPPKKPFLLWSVGYLCCA